jgi:hypothetical protein
MYRGVNNNEIITKLNNNNNKQFSKQMQYLQWFYSNKAKWMEEYLSYNDIVEELHSPTPNPHSPTG